MADEDVDIGTDDRGIGSPDVEMDDDPSIKRRGRGFDPRGNGPATDGVKHGGSFDLLDGASASRGGGDAGPDVVADEKVARSVEGFIVIVSGIHEEATEEEVTDKFADYGTVKNCHLNLDRRTGYVKGYALLEFETKEEAKAAIEACREGALTLMDETLKADFAFVQPPAGAGGGVGGGRGRGRRDRSRSPGGR